MPADDHGPQIQDDRKYEALRRQGMSKQKSARIANAGNSAARRGAQQPAYDDWTTHELYEKAREVGIAGRSGMKKEQLIAALRQGQGDS